MPQSWEPDEPLAEPGWAANVGTSFTDTEYQQRFRRVDPFNADGITLTTDGALGSLSPTFKAQANGLGYLKMRAPLDPIGMEFTARRDGAAGEANRAMMWLDNRDDLYQTDNLNLSWTFVIQATPATGGQVAQTQGFATTAGKLQLSTPPITATGIPKGVRGGHRDVVTHGNQFGLGVGKPQRFPKAQTGVGGGVATGWRGSLMGWRVQGSHVDVTNTLMSYDEGAYKAVDGYWLYVAPVGASAFAPDANLLVILYATKATAPGVVHRRDLTSCIIQSGVGNLDTAAPMTFRVECRNVSGDVEIKAFVSPYAGEEQQLFAAGLGYNALSSTSANVTRDSFGTVTDANATYKLTGQGTTAFGGFGDRVETYGQDGPADISVVEGLASMRHFDLVTEDVLVEDEFTRVGVSIGESAAGSAVIVATNRFGETGPTLENDWYWGNNANTAHFSGRVSPSVDPNEFGATAWDPTPYVTLDPSPAVVTQLTTTSNVWINVAEIADFSPNNRISKNILRASREWISETIGGGIYVNDFRAITTNANGIVTSLLVNQRVGTLMFRDNSFDNTLEPTPVASYRSGTYVILHDGSPNDNLFQVAFDAGSLTQPTPGVARWTFTVPTPTLSGIYFGITQVGATAPTYIRILHSTDESGFSDSNEFDDAWTATRSQFPVVRWMESQGINTDFTDTTTTAEIKPENYIRWNTGEGGVPHQKIISYHQNNGGVPWVCIPPFLDDAGVQAIATIYRDNWDGDVIFEYANETWNSFPRASPPPLNVNQGNWDVNGTGTFPTLTAPATFTGGDYWTATNTSNPTVLGTKSINDGDIIVSDYGGDNNFDFEWSVVQSTSHVDAKGNWEYQSLAPASAVGLYANDFQPHPQAYLAAQGKLVIGPNALDPDPFVSHYKGMGQKARDVMILIEGVFAATGELSRITRVYGGFWVNPFSTEQAFSEPTVGDHFDAISVGLYTPSFPGAIDLSQSIDDIIADMEAERPQAKAWTQAHYNVCQTLGKPMWAYEIGQQNASGTGTDIQQLVALCEDEKIQGWMDGFLGDWNEVTDSSPFTWYNDAEFGGVGIGIGRFGYERYVGEPDADAPIRVKLLELLDGGTGGPGPEVVNNRLDVISLRPPDKVDSQHRKITFRPGAHEGTSGNPNYPSGGTIQYFGLALFANTTAGYIQSAIAAEVAMVTDGAGAQSSLLARIGLFQASGIGSLPTWTPILTQTLSSPPNLLDGSDHTIEFDCHPFSGPSGANVYLVKIDGSAVIWTASDVAPGRNVQLAGTGEVIDLAPFKTSGPCEGYYFASALNEQDGFGAKLWDPWRVTDWDQLVLSEGSGPPGGEQDTVPLGGEGTPSGQDFHDVLTEDFSITEETVLLSTIHQFDSGHGASFPHWDTRRRTYRFSAGALDPTQVAALRTFWDDHKGAEIPFTWTQDGQSQLTVAFVQDSLVIDNIAPRTWAATFVIREVLV